MERNDGQDVGVGNGASSPDEFSGTTPPAQDTGFDFSGSDGTTGTTASAGPADQTQNVRDRARNVIGTAGDRLADVGSGIREKAGTARNRLVGALEAGADRLRERGQAAGSGQLAGATADGTVPLENDGRLTHVTDSVAGGMQATADWLRDADIESLKTGVEKQVRDHPGRTLLIAAGLGYLIGRAIRK